MFITSTRFAALFGTVHPPNTDQHPSVHCETGETDEHGGQCDRATAAHCALQDGYEEPKLEQHEHELKQEQRYKHAGPLLSAVTVRILQPASTPVANTSPSTISMVILLSGVVGGPWVGLPSSIEKAPL
jgi:hypothetical protein